MSVYLRTGEFRSTRGGGEVARVIHVDKTLGRVQFGYWSGLLRGDKAWMDHTLFSRKYPIVVTDEAGR